MNLMETTHESSSRTSTSLISRTLDRLLRIQSTDRDVQRRGRAFIVLCSIFFVLNLFTVPLLFLLPDSIRHEWHLVGPWVVVSYAVGIILTRKGKLNLAGMVVGMLISGILTVAGIFSGTMGMALWFILLSVFVAGFAVRPGLLWWLFGFDLLCFALIAVFIGLETDETGTLRMPFAANMLLIATLATYLYARSNQQAFHQLNQNTQALALAKEQAERANRAKSSFLANMSHELRTPLNAIIGYSEMMLEDETPPDRAVFAQDLSKIRSAGRHLVSMINDILDLAKIEAGRVEMNVDTLLIPELIEDVTSMIRPMSDLNHNTLTVEIDPQLNYLVSDRAKLKQILINLLSNAAKFTQHGEIRLTVEQLREHPGATDQDFDEPDWTSIRFSVEDSGIGIPPDKLDNIFEEFEQVRHPQTIGVGGTGLGLALCRRLSAMLGGEIHVKSEEGKGSTFSVTVPTTLADSEVAAAPLAKSTIRLTGGHVGQTVAQGPEILVIDDDPATRDMQIRNLSREGFRVHVAATGEEGLALVRRLHPDVILLDILLPGMDGWEVLRCLKEDPALRSIPVILITVVDNAEHGLALGASDYLLKPIHRERLLNALHSLPEQLPSEKGFPQNLLVVEDDPQTREILRRMLERESCSVQEASRGEDVFPILEHTRPDVILLDLMMPGMDGFEVLRRVRERRDWKDIPVIIVTAKDLTVAEMRILRQGASQVLLKSGLSTETLLRETHRAARTAN